MNLASPKPLACALLVAAGIFLAGRSARTSLGSGELVVFHAPSTVTRKAPPLTANITGRWSGDEPLRYRVNGGDWQELVPSPPRMQKPWFALEIDSDRLLPHAQNEVEIAAGLRAETLRFSYDPSPARLPIEIDWSKLSGRELEAQDGIWETLQVDGEWRVRPVPGTEDYDRLLCVTPSFSGGRRVECDIVLRRATQPDQLMGVGVLSYWAGHPDDEGVRPRRGWSFAIGWYYTLYGAVGMEFSHKAGGAPYHWVSSYRNEYMPPNVPHRLVMESWAERGAEGVAKRYRARLKWWPRGEDEPGEWQEIVDRPGGELLESEYCVALVAHRCQAEFGAVRVTAIDDVVVESR
ncbi:MAG: hypothetical protein IT457_10365 [Planctomycetes bacterium]|nr:hypothetical protein [Planctomycetota bacterium]